MRFKEILLLPCLMVGLAAPLGCGKADQAAQEQRNQGARFTRLIDERRYDEVIRVFEGSPEARQKFPELLAMAHLGAAGFEPLRFATQVAARQMEPDAGLERLIPDCPVDALQRYAQLPMRCMIKRIFAHLPDADAAQFAQARVLFRASYGDPETTAPELNTLIATVEAASALSRLRKVTMEFEPEAPLRPFYAQMIEAAQEATQTLARARHSTRAVSKLMTGVDAHPLFAADLNGKLAWLEETGIPLLLEFARDHAPEETRTTEDALRFVQRLRAIFRST